MTTKTHPRFALCAITVLVSTLALYALTVPFDPSHGLVEVEVLLDGRVKARFGIDTGADRLYLDQTFARKHGFTFAQNTRRREVVGVEGASSVSYVDLESLTIGEEVLRDLRATAIDMRDLVRHRGLPVPDGLVGFSVLRRFLVTVDYPACTLTLQTNQPRFLSGRKYSEFSFRQRKHLILVDVTIDNQITCPMILVYCASYTSITPELAVKLGLDVSAGYRQSVGRISLHDPRSGPEVASHDVPVVVTDMLAFRRFVPRAEFDGILGGTFLRDHILTVDYRNQRLYIRR